MRGTSHRIAGACSAAVVASFMFQGELNNPAAYLAIGGAVIGGAFGGLLPDIDHPESTIGRRLKPISYVVNTVFGHRGFTHTIFSLILLSYLLFIISGWIPVSIKGFALAMFTGIIIGYSSHLLLDMLTVSGIPLLYPFSNRMFRVARLRTGRDDWIVTTTTILVTALFLFYII